MSFPIVEPFPQDGDINFNAKAHACMDSLRTASVEANAAMTQIDAAVLAVQAGAVATLWVSGTTYAINARVFSPSNWNLYVRKTAGAGATDPASDPGNWQNLTFRGLPIQVVTGTSIAAAWGVHYLMTNPAQSTLTLPDTATAMDMLGVTWANARADNLYAPNGLRLLNQTDTVAEDAVGLSVHIVYTGPTYGAAIFGA